MRRILPTVMCLILSGQCLPALSASESASEDVNFKIYSPAAENNSNPVGMETPLPAENPSSGPVLDKQAPSSDAASLSPAAAGEASPTASAEATPATAADGPAKGEKASGEVADGEKIATRVLQGYIRVVPAHTKIPIIMDTAVESETSQEGDEFSARTGEDLTIDGQVVVPAGSVIKGRIAQLNAPRHLNRSGSVALKFDTVTTPDNRQIPLVATIVAHGGVVHARRGAKDIILDAGIVSLPTVLGLGIGALAGGGSGASKIGGRAGAAMIGAAVGVAVGTAIICAKKGKKVDVRPGDELKIELSEDLRMPMGG